MHDPAEVWQSAGSLSRLLAGDVVRATAGLIGCVIARRLPPADRKPNQPPVDRIVRAMIVEAEAYHMREPGCHAYRGRTKRNAVMFGPAGKLYVYFTYGMWYCCNVVCEATGTAAAVLLRAAAPLAPDDGMHQKKPKLRLSGPGLLCRGLELSTEQSGVSLMHRAGEVWLYRPTGWQPPPLSWTTRIGLSFADPHRWRCYWTNHPAVSPARPGILKRKQAR